MELGKRLAEARVRAGMTQEQVGTKLGITHVVVNRFENETRMPSVLTLKALADIYNVSTDYLLGIDGRQGIQGSSA